MTVAYFDASALVKLVIEEAGSDDAAALWDGADLVMASRIVHAEVRAALAAAHRARRLDADVHRAAKLAVAKNSVALEVDLDDADAIAFVDLEVDRQRRGGNFFSLFSDDGVRMAARSQQFFNHAYRAADFHRVVDVFFRDTDTPLAKRLEHV